jgi:hypothetical protein
MSISDDQYRAWLAADGKQRCLLIEAKCYHSGSEITRYFSNYAYITGPSETPANQPYEDILASTPSFRMSIDAPLAVGDLEIRNENGERDSWLDDGWDGRAITMYLGDPNWARADFRTILTGIIEDIASADRSKLAFSVRDRKEKLNVPVQTALYSGGAIDNQPKPLACGQPANITPVLIDPANLIYQVHDGAIYDILGVRDKGVAVAFTEDLATGTFALSASPDGSITCDVVGANPSGTSPQSPADIIQYLVTREILTTGDIDAASFAAFAPGGLNIGLYLRERRNLVDVVDEIVATAGGYWYFDRSGKLKLWRLDSPTGTAVAEFDADDIEAGGLRIIRRELPVYRQRLGVDRNWTIQGADDLAATITDREIYAQEFAQIRLIENSGIKTAHPAALEPDVVPTLYRGFDVDEEARRATLRAVPRHVYEARMTGGAFQLNLGDEIKLTHPRFGFESGANAIVIGIEEAPSRNRVTLELWR